MRKFQNQDPVRKIIYSWPAIFVLFLAAVFLGKSAINTHFNASLTRATYLDVRSKHEDLLVKKTDLEKRLDYLSSAYGLERELRRKFGLVKPGEELMIIVDRPQENERPVDGDNLSAFFSGVAGLFGGLFGFGR